VAVHSEYNGQALKDGERATVHFVSYDKTLLDITVLTGAYAGWRLEESDGGSAEIFLAFMGIALFCAASYENRRDLKLQKAASAMSGRVARDAKRKSRKS